MDKALPKDMPALLKEIEDEWRLLWQVAERLTPEQMVLPDAGGWSPKDNLAHLAEWMRYMQRAYLSGMPGAQAMGIEAERFRQLDENGINAVLFERNRGRPASEVLADLKETYAAALDAVRTRPYADLLKPIRPGSDERLLMDGVRGNTSEHFHEHRENMQRSLAPQ